MEKMEEKNRH